MSQITVKGKIEYFSQLGGVRIGTSEDHLVWIDTPPSDWKEGQDVEITIRSVENERLP